MGEREVQVHGNTRTHKASVSTLKEIENIFSRVPIRYRNTRGSLGELENCVETPAARTRVSSTRVSINCKETRKMFSIS